MAFCLVALIVLVELDYGNLVADDTTKATDTIEVTHDYIGAKKCKICHKEEFASWEVTVHAKAFDLLKDDEKKNDKCIACHTTGTTKYNELLEGVQCEACHGPGADYKKKNIMEDRELAIKKGLILPTEELCVRCHNENSPTFKGFDFAKYSRNEKALHELEGKKETESKSD